MNGIHEVVGSIPISSTNDIKGLAIRPALLFLLSQVPVIFAFIPILKRPRLNQWCFIVILKPIHIHVYAIYSLATLMMFPSS